MGAKKTPYPLEFREQLVALDESIPALESAQRLGHMAEHLGKPYEAVVAKRITPSRSRMQRAGGPGYPQGYLAETTEWILMRTGNR